MKLIITTTNNKKHAKELASKLISHSLATCISIEKIHSLYIYNSKECNEKEYKLEIKTDIKFKKVAKFITKHHIYKLPQIITIKANSTKAYKNWIKRKTNEAKSN